MMAMNQEGSLIPFAEGGNAQQEPTTDPILLQVLLDIRTSLQRIESQLVPDRSDRDQRMIAYNPPNIENVPAVVPRITDEQITRIIERMPETHREVLEENSVQNDEVDSGIEEYDLGVESDIEDYIRGEEQVCQ